MIRILDFEKVPLSAILSRDIRAEADVNAAVDAILSDVRQNGDAALFKYTERFDGAKLNSLLVTPEELDEALAATDPYFLETLRQAAENIRAFHEKQLHNDFVLTRPDGVVMGQRYTPIENVGVCVPGNTAAYPSTVLMNAIPAKLAGVGQIVMAASPDENGRLPAPVLAAAKLSGVTTIVKAGGAQAVAAMAYGTESVPKVDKIVGPGGIYVATAKRKVFGLVSIDMIAGPSEILVLADEKTNPAWAAADLLSQAEHDKYASAVLVTNNRALALAVQEQIEEQLIRLPRADIARASIEENGKIVVTKSLDAAVEAVNAIAPEHLELCVEDPFSLLGRIKNAGSIFLGRHAPEALGDYFAGPNHTLPTSGTARFSSPLSVDDFVKKSSFLYYTPEALESCAPRVADFAGHEGLHAHARSVTIRTEKSKQKEEVAP